MPTLQFKGKNVIWNHHLSIPYHTLEEDTKLSYQPEKGVGNLIIEGDNLLALRALLPMYNNSIDRVYIDPPYNTGNPDSGIWIYNDNVNSPLIKDWIGKEVGRDDLTRHDKWLCMITPRLQLLKELLSDTGIIFISIDDNEFHNLYSIMVQIFGEGNELAILTWRGMHTVRNSSKDFNKNTEYVICFARNKSALIKAGSKETYLRYFIDKSDNYPHDDNDGKGPYKLDPLYARNFYTPYVYKFKNGIVWKAPEGSFPRYSEDTLTEMDEQNEIVFNGEPKAKRYLSRVQEGVPPDTLLPVELVGFNKDGTSELSALFDGKKVFNQPKPVSLIKHLLRTIRKNDKGKEFLVLDAFAGSGTTMHAALALNQEEDKDIIYKSILIQMTENTATEPDKNICRDVTRERLKRVIKKYNYDSGFKYLRLGNPVDSETMLNGELPSYNQFAKYVYYLCTGKTLLDTKKISEGKYLIGKNDNSVIYLIYKQDFAELTKLALTLTLAETFKRDNPNKRIIVYAPACFLDQEYLEENQIEFVNIPYNLFQRSK